MKTSVKHRLPEVVAQVGQVPGIVREGVRQGLNATAQAGRRAIYDAMRRAFKNPTPYTLNAVRVEEAKEGGPLAAGVMVKGRPDADSGAIPQQSYLRAQINGGGRRFKRFEILLWRRGYLPRGRYAVPGKGARLDGYGNMSRGQIVELIAYFSAFPVAKGERAGGYRSNSTVKTRAKRAAGNRNRAGFVYFVQPVGAAGLPPGIYRRQSVAARFVGAPDRRPLMVVAFVTEPRYSRRLMFWGELQRVSNERLAANVDAGMYRARRKRRLKDEAR